MNYWCEALRGHEPFVRMHEAHVWRLLEGAREHYAPPGAMLMQPEDGFPDRLCWVRQGSVIGRPVLNAQEAFELEAGSLWPVSALLAGRPVRTHYQAHDDCFYLSFPWSLVQTVMQDSDVLSQYLQQQAESVLQASARTLRQALQTQWQQGAELERSLLSLPAKQVVSLPQRESLRQALTTMHQRQVGSVLLVGDDGQPSGILTRHDLLDRVVLAARSLDEPVALVMSQPVHTVDANSTLADAAVQMARHGIRHLPVLHNGRVINVVSERDLFALQQQTLRQVGGQVVAATTVAELRSAASAIRDLAAHLLAQGAPPQMLTRLISDLNDRLTRRIIELQLLQSGPSDQHMCWVALGSEGRHEQTISTDQDNALIFQSEQPALDRPRWQAFARQVNETLDACGYPLCKGGIMASTTAWCKTLQEWRDLCAQWIERGAPEDLLNAAVLFDLRALAGPSDWVDNLQQDMLERVRRNPRFLRQWVENHLQTGVALNWHGGLATQAVNGQEVIDIKLSGTAIVVDAARILALSCGLQATSTTERLRQAGQRLGVPQAEYEGWVTAFSHLQMLRLQQQILAAQDHASANQLPVDRLNAVERQMLKTVFRSLRGLQQRLQLDYLR